MANSIKAKKLIATNRDSENKQQYRVNLHEFANGAILVEGDFNADWFFDSRDEYEPNGNDICVEIEETGEYSDWTKEELKQSIADSESNYSYSVGAKVRSLI